MSLNALNDDARFCGDVGVQLKFDVDPFGDSNTRGWGRGICMDFHGRTHFTCRALGRKLGMNSPE